MLRRNTAKGRWGILEMNVPSNSQPLRLVTHRPTHWYYWIRSNHVGRLRPALKLLNFELLGEVGELSHMDLKYGTAMTSLLRGASEPWRSTDPGGSSDCHGPPHFWAFGNAPIPIRFGGNYFSNHSDNKVRLCKSNIYLFILSGRITQVRGQPQQLTTK